MAFLEGLRNLPDWDAFGQAVGILIVATPFMFGVLGLFSVTTWLLSRIPERRQ